MTQYAKGKNKGRLVLYNGSDPDWLCISKTFAEWDRIFNNSNGLSSKRFRAGHPMDEARNGGYTRREKEVSAQTKFLNSWLFSSRAVK